MKRLEFRRRGKGWSQRKLGEIAGVNASYICNAEKRGMILYPPQAKRIAEALGWKGDPAALFEDVTEDDLATA